uniref:Alternative protein COMP n=1 Tax=Homo sapiens TaxID=9606 RepID=L8E6U6_HUMAN|nr:alternative protein COMP [Homo sapiens]
MWTAMASETPAIRMPTGTGSPMKRTTARWCGTQTSATRTRTSGAMRATTAGPRRTTTKRTQTRTAGAMRATTTSTATGSATRPTTALGYPTQTRRTVMAMV